MKKNLVFLIAATLFLGTKLSAIPVITIVSAPGTSPLLESYEITFNMNAYSNPYDPAIINSYCEFWSPTGKYYKVYAFYYEDFTKQDNPSPTPNFPLCITYNCEALTSNTVSNWKIRFTPNETGTWQYRITSIDQSGVTSLPSTKAPNYFICNPSSSKGFIVKANSKFLKRSAINPAGVRTDELFFQVGENACWTGWPIWQGQQTFGTNQYNDYIDKLSLNGANFMRVWFDMNDGMSLVGKEFTDGTIAKFDSYNQKDSWQLDKIFEYAKSKNVNIMLTLFCPSSWGDINTNSAWTNDNGFNVNNGGHNLTSPFNFFSDPTAIADAKNMMRYIIARYGAQTNLTAWELWNEVGQIRVVNPPLLPQDETTLINNIGTWHNIMYAYIKQIDPFKHLVTTSACMDEPILIDQQLEHLVFNIMDFTTSHPYKYPIEPQYYSSTNHSYFDLQNKIFQDACYASTNYNKPYFAGEFGFSDFSKWRDFDPNGFELHNTLWSSAFSTSFGTATNWSWDEYIKCKDLFFIYKPITTFMNSLPIPSASFTPYQISDLTNPANNNGLRTYYMKNANTDTVYGWTQDINFHWDFLYTKPDGTVYPNLTGQDYLMSLTPTSKPNSSSTNNDISIPISSFLNNKLFKVEWFDAQTGNLYQQTTVTSANNKVIISIPINLRTSTFGDAVFKVYLDCNQFVWRGGVLNTGSGEVAGSVISSRITGQVFYKTANGFIHSIYWDGGSNTWQNAPFVLATNVAGDLAINQDGSKVFFRTTDNNINGIFWNSTLNSWQLSNLNLATIGNVKGPIAVDPSGQVFYRTLDYKLKSVTMNSSGVWIRSDLNYAANGNVGDAMTISPDGKQVFYKTMDNRLNSIYISSGVWNYSNLNNAATNVGGNITISPFYQVFYRTTDNRLNNIYYSSGSWNHSDLNFAAINVAGDLMSDAAGQIFYRTTSNTINSIYFANGIWNLSTLDNSTGAYNVNSTSSNLALFADGTNESVFYRGADNNIHRIYYRSLCDNNPSTNFRRPDTSLEEIEQTANAERIIENNKELIIFPNPSTGIINISGEKGGGIINVLNIIGVNVLTQKTEEQTAIVDCSSLKNGIYFIQVVNDGHVLNKKMVIEH